MVFVDSTMRELLKAFASDEARVRLAASKSLRDLSQRQPARVYPHFDVLAGLLTHENNVLKWNAILALANLASVDREGRIDRLLDEYLTPIAGPVMITAANIIKGATLIALVKPHLADRIAHQLMRVEKAKYATPECRDVAIGHTLEALRMMIVVVSDTRAVRKFAARHIDNPRRATALKARRLLARAAA